MTEFAIFLNEALFEGRVSLHAPPPPAGDADAGKVLRQAHEAQMLALAGPPLIFDERTALAAALLFAHAGWYFLNPGLAIEAPEKTLGMPLAPTKPEHHLSADLALRFLPALLRRAEALQQEDVLPLALQRVLRQWPLSGVLSDIAEPPLTSVDFGTHPGLNFLYAERLAKHERPGWLPQGRGMQYVELVWEQLGKDVSVLPALQEVAEEIRHPVSIQETTHE
jgi:hypothetical protein